VIANFSEKHTVTKINEEGIWNNFSEGQTLVTLGPYFQMFAPYYKLLGDLHFATNLLYPALFSVTFVIVLINYHMQI